MLGIIIMASTWLLFVGLHNIDLGANFMRLGFRNVIDTGMLGVTRTPLQLYTNGLDAVFISWVGFMFAIILGGVWFRS